MMARPSETGSRASTALIAKIAQLVRAVTGDFHDLLASNVKRLPQPFGIGLGFHCCPEELAPPKRSRRLPALHLSKPFAIQRADAEQEGVNFIQRRWRIRYCRNCSDARSTEPISSAPASVRFAMKNRAPSYPVSIQGEGQMTEVIRGHDLGDAMDRLWANAALPRVTGLVGKPEPEDVSALTGDHPFCNEQPREAGSAQQAPASNHGD